MNNQNNTINSNGAHKIFWVDELKKKVKSMPGVKTGLPDKSLKRMQHNDDVSFYESVN